MRRFGMSGIATARRLDAGTIVIAIDVDDAGSGEESMWKGK